MKGDFVFLGFLALVLLFLGIIGLLAFFTPVIENALRLTTDNNFQIPTESNLVIFTVNEKISSKPGWEYGQDVFNFYYHSEGNTTIIDRQSAIECVGFESTDIDTWCIESI